jgi:hypothetical protein
MRTLKVALFYVFTSLAFAGAQTTARCGECDAADMTVSSFRWERDPDGRAIIWFQFKNLSGVTWYISAVRCDFYDDTGHRRYGRTFELDDFAVYGSVPLRESGGFEVNVPDDLVKLDCWIERARADRSGSPR